jgi:hypothetical protein
MRNLRSRHRSMVFYARTFRVPLISQEGLGRVRLHVNRSYERKSGWRPFGASRFCERDSEVAITGGLRRGTRLHREIHRRRETRRHLAALRRGIRR